MVSQINSFQKQDEPQIYSKENNSDVEEEYNRDLLEECLKHKLTSSATK